MQGLSSPRLKTASFSGIIETGKGPAPAGEEKRAKAREERTEKKLPAALRKGRARGRRKREENGMRLVNTTGNLKKYMHSRSVAAPVAEMRKTGFRHLDLSMYGIVYEASPWILPGDGWKKEIGDAAEAAAKNGLDFCQAHSPDGEHFAPGEKRDALILATRRSIEACAMLSIPHTVLHAQAYPNATPTEFLEKNVEFLKLFEEDAEKFGVDLLIENSATAWNPEYYLRTGREMREFVERAGMKRLHICWDVGHGNVQGRNQYDDILAMGSELHALHVQDNYGDADSHLMPMIGTTNFDRVLTGLIDSGYRGDFTFEGDSTLRSSGQWPHYRRDVSPGDRLGVPPLEVQIRLDAAMYEIGKWMLESYGLPVE